MDGQNEENSKLGYLAKNRSKRTPLRSFHEIATSHSCGFSTSYTSLSVDYIRQKANSSLVLTKISDEIYSLKRKRYELQTELSKLNRKQQQSQSYMNKRQKHNHDISDTDSYAPVSPLSDSSRSATVSPTPDDAENSN